MKRDSELIRQLMLALETSERPFSATNPIEGFTQPQVAYHLALIVDSGLAVGNVQYSLGSRDSTVPTAALAFRLTPEGHDFIDTIRDETIWNKTKQKVATVGGSVSIGVLKEIATALAKSALGLAN
ncbi:DUF2513 domain-containing protein [Stenotrophomonas sp. RS-48]|uniref:DUF2513 domain-containing protein n=1 Tax=Stenotrophomonas sp. RS-48 TaxID=3043300 RepID=UPI0024B4EEA3|nr:DUF2513 domain-containing protein [Stenotrophomonas sp. RS-48]MDI9247117.1 DUF2513 domain-containing protein [Stenotrophomonas sp. RS-48]